MGGSHFGQASQALTIESLAVAGRLRQQKVEKPGDAGLDCARAALKGRHKHFVVRISRYLVKTCLARSLKLRKPILLLFSNVWLSKLS